MAIYIGNYTSDLQKIFRLVFLQVYLRSVADRDKTDTDLESDRQYLPSIFLQNVIPFERGMKTCSLDGITPRFAKLYIGANSYLHVDFPFLPGTTEYIEFFRQNNAKSNIVTIGIEGEKINPDYLRFYGT
jgi:hypothetical protein